MQGLREIEDLIKKGAPPTPDPASTRPAEKVGVFRNIGASVNAVGDAAFLYVLQPTLGNRALIYDSADDLSRQFESLRTLPLTAPERALAEKSDADWRALRRPLDRVVSLKAEKDQLIQQFLDLTTKLDGLLDEGIQVHAARQLAATLAHVKTGQSTALLWMIVGILVSAAGAIFTFVWITYSVRSILNSLIGGAEAIASGDMNLRLPVSGFADFDRIIYSFNRMTDRLRDTTVSKTLLEKSEQRFDHAVRGSQAGIWDWDLAADTYYPSPRFKEMLGYSDAEVPNERAFFLSHLHPDDIDRVNAARLALFERREPYDVEYRMRRKDGRYIWCRGVGNAVWDEAGNVVRFSGSTMDIDVQKQAEARIERMAYYDSLTDLPGRELFIDRLQQAMNDADRRRRLVAVLFMDLDRFKIVNDTLGHQAGDELLRQTSRCLQDCVRRGDTVGRFSGDEFCVALADIGQMDDVAALVKNFLYAFALPFTLAGKESFISLSIGIALYPVDADTVSSLLHAADTAMYRTKQQGGNSWQFYASTMTVMSHDRMEIEGSLHRAIENGQFVLHYQPIVSPSGRILGVEALIRWQHPERGLLPPLEFIAIAEETGPIGEWVLQTACGQLRRWNEAGFRDLTLAVNVSPRQFRQKDLGKTMKRIASEAGIDPARLEIEITESLLTGSEEDTAILGEFAAIGMRLSVDDFGTGYSSLAYLKRFPIRTIKIDRTFVSGIPDNAEDAAIVLAIIAMAKSLGIRLVAEGVETAGQLDFLRAQGCDSIQGFYFCKPLPADAITALLSEGRRLGPPAAAPDGAAARTGV